MSLQSLRTSPSDHLLRMLASVPVSSSILDLGCGAGCHTEALLRLGFPVHATDPRPAAVRKTRSIVTDLVDADTSDRCVREATLDELADLDASFDWIVADRAEVYVHTEADLASLFTQSHRLLTPGGWVYVTVPAEEAEASPQFEASALAAGRFEVALAESRTPEVVEEEGEARVRALYRRVEATSPA